jgi:hypothetical protein
LTASITAGAIATTVMTTVHQNVYVNAWRPSVVLTSTHVAAATASDRDGSGAGAFVPKVHLPNADLADLLGGSSP